MVYNGGLLMLAFLYTLFWIDSYFLFLKIISGLVEWLKHLPSKCEAPSSNFSATKKVEIKNHLCVEMESGGATGFIRTL
jgi:hypothetical protein